EEDRVALFQPFQQGESGMRQGGTGLGLTISQRQLGLMGSELEVESRVGEGSCFSFAIELPPAREEVAEEGIEAWSRVTGLAPGRRVRALVADDVAENREILSSMLGGIGVEVEVVENGKEALDRMEESLPDVVFLDIRMPVLDGLETLELVQEDERWRQVKVVAVSASVLDHERAEFLQAGFDDFLDKPFRFEDVCGSLAQHLGVEFVYGEGGEEESVGGMGDWRGISLPEDLVSGLVKAAEFYSVTEIEGYLQEMESLGEGERRLASHLRDLRRQHNMEGIIEILGTINHG
ncbi:MAG: response regulator, partial [Gemmatimonadetes bacterium]|nr:response regulator [Gemmatimonadota bacterium]